MLCILKATELVLLLLPSKYVASYLSYVSSESLRLSVSASDLNVKNVYTLANICSLLSLDKDDYIVCVVTNAMLACAHEARWLANSSDLEKMKLGRFLAFRFNEDQ